MTAARKVVIPLKSVEFQVFGRVQRVFFRKNTRIQADNHGLVGWVKNTPRGTVVGVVQGREDKLELMKEWLRCVGSKGSRIEKCEFKKEMTIFSLDYKSFKIER